MNKINYFQVEFKNVEIKGEVIKIKGYASTPTIDRYNDIVDPKAFSNSIIEYMKNPIILLQHDWNKPVWKATDYKLNFKWLEVEVEISNDIENLFNNIKTWILKGFSIWYIPTKWEYIEENWIEIRKITWLDLIEISVVSTPANKESLFTLSKSIKSFFNNLQNENMKTEIKELEVKEEVIEEVKAEEVVVDEIIEGSNITETLDEIEKSSENLETLTETVENTEEVVKDESKEDEVKEIDLLKNEIKELKSSIDWIVEILKLTIENQTEIKSIVNKIPARKGLITTWITESKSSLSKQLEEIKKNNFII